MLAGNLQTFANLNPGAQVRAACRSGQFRGPTAGHAPGHLQGNLVILPASLGFDFLRFCILNPKPCPLIGVAEAGSYALPQLGEDIDLRTDLPGYHVWRNGTLIAQTDDISSLWRADLVAFVIGCSMSFEAALQADGIPIRHIEACTTVPMYVTNMECQAAGPFKGPMVVSMRPMKARDAIRAIQITSRYSAVHGAPVHLGDPALIGIRNLDAPDFGDPVRVMDDEIPVFWACGVTPQAVIAKVRPEFAITHAPGAMLVTDRMNSEFESR